MRRSFVSCLDRLLEGGSRVAIATHDEHLIGESLVRVAPLAPDAYEFQMLLGVRESRADELVAAGPSGARVRALRAALVRVLAAAPAGEPADGRRDRQGDPREGYRPQLMVP